MSIFCACALALPASAQPKNSLLRFFKQTAAKTAAGAEHKAAEVSFARAAQEAEALLANATLRTRTLYWTRLNKTYTILFLPFPRSDTKTDSTGADL